LNSGTSLKSGVGVVQGHRKWHYSTDRIRFSNWSATVSIVVSSTISELFDVEEFRDLEGSLEVTGHDTIR